MNRLIGLIMVLFVISASQVFAQDKVYKIGDTGPSGGFVFFDKGALTNGWRYLETAPVDNVDTSVFSDVYEAIGTTKTGIGEGKANTKAIIEQTGHKESAAKLCDDLEVAYNGKTFSDYFLPSKDELNLMYENLYKNGVGGFSADNIYYYYYWSSSEYDENCVWYQFFNEGKQTYFSKPYDLLVLCSRAF